MSPNDNINEEVMKKLVTLSLVGAVMALGACSSSNTAGGRVIHNNEEAAPYADERTVGRYKPAEKTFYQVQSK
jgi:hypothetical protein